jgi:hypothetical protein
MHIYYIHRITTKEYQDMFGLNHTGILAEETRALLKQHNFNHKGLVVSQNLVNNPKSIAKRWVKNDQRIKDRPPLSAQELSRRKKHEQKGS